MKKKNLTILTLSMALMVCLSLVCGLAAALYSKTVTKNTETVTVAKFGVVMTWGGNLFNGSQIAPGDSGSTTLTLSGEADVAVKISLGAVHSEENWTLADETDYNPIVFTVKVGDNYLQADKSYSATKHTFTIDQLNNLELASYAANETLTRTFTIGWEWNSSRVESGYYVCTGNSLYNVGDIITADTVETEELSEEFSVATTADIDSYLASKAESPTITLTLSASDVEQV